MFSLDPQVLHSVFIQVSVPFARASLFNCSHRPLGRSGSTRTGTTGRTFPRDSFLQHEVLSSVGGKKPSPALDRIPLATARLRGKMCVRFSSPGASFQLLCLLVDQDDGSLLPGCSLHHFQLSCHFQRCTSHWRHLGEGMSGLVAWSWDITSKNKLCSILLT